MDHDSAIFLLVATLKIAALVAAPVLLSSLITGVLISIIQVVTQIQESTLTFVPKLAVAVFVLMVFGGWMLNTIADFAIQLFQHATMVGK